MTKRHLTLIAFALAALLIAGCGGGEPAGGGEGGGSAEAPSGGKSPADKVASCLNRGGAKAQVNPTGAELVSTEGSTGAVVAEVESNTVNIVFFPDAESAKRANRAAQDKEKSDRVGQTTVVGYRLDAKGEQEDAIFACLGQEKKKKK